MMTTMTTAPSPAPALLVLADGLVLRGEAFGASGTAIGEVVFNTGMTGYQEVMTDPSYAGQIVTFTFPHIGNVGANADDQEESSAQGMDAARGAVFKAPPTLPSSWRASDELGVWLNRRNIIGLSGVDTRALTRRIRELGMIWIRINSDNRVVRTVRR